MDKDPVLYMIEVWHPKSGDMMFDYEVDTELRVEECYDHYKVFDGDEGFKKVLEIPKSCLIVKNYK